MGKERVKRRRSRIRSKQNRRLKLAKLRQKFLTAKTETDKNKILDKVFKISPRLTEKEFLASLESA